MKAHQLTGTTDRRATKCRQKACQRINPKLLCSPTATRDPPHLQARQHCVACVVQLQHVWLEGLKGHHTQLPEQQAHGAAELPGCCVFCSQLAATLQPLLAGRNTCVRWVGGGREGGGVRVRGRGRRQFMNERGCLSQAQGRWQTCRVHMPACGMLPTLRWGS
jgi:hypothetical protein